LRGAQAARAPRRLGQRLDELDEFVALIAVPARELEKLQCAGMHDALLSASDYRHATAAAKFEQSFVPKVAERAQDRIAVDAEDCGEVAHGRQAVARLCFSLGNRPPDLRGDLLVEVGPLCSIQLDVKHLCYA
jgi:hypothetical protein